MSDHAGDREVARVVEVRHPALGLTGLLVIDSLPTHGHAFGGIRRMAYPSRAAAWEDARRLARAMSHKCALARLPVGGAKMVLWDREDSLGQGAYEFLGDVVEELGGAYVCGPDVGTDEPRMTVVRGRTRWANPVGNTPGPRTAQGVLAGMRGAATVAFGSASLEGKHVGVHGLGSVGLALAEGLLVAGATVRGWDVSAAAMSKAAGMGVSPLASEDALLGGDMDVFAPCSVGGLLEERVAARLDAAVVCGSANNVLATAEAGEALFHRGVVFVPDIVVNAGAVIEGVYTVLRREGTPIAGTVDAHVEATESRCRDILAQAKERGVPPEVHALASAEAELDRRERDRAASAEGA